MVSKQLVLEQVNESIKHHLTYSVSKKRELTRKIGEFAVRNWFHAIEATYAVGFPWYVTGDYTPPFVIQRLKTYEERIKREELSGKELTNIYMNSIPDIDMYLIFRTPSISFSFLDEIPYDKLTEWQKQTVLFETLDVSSFKRFEDEFDIKLFYRIPTTPSEIISKILLDLVPIPDRSFVYTLSVIQDWDNSLIGRDVMFSMTPVSTQPKYDRAIIDFVRRIVGSARGDNIKEKLMHVKERFPEPYSALLEDNNVLETWEKRMTNMLYDS